MLAVTARAQPAAGMSTRQNPPQLTHGAMLPYRLNVFACNCGDLFNNRGISIKPEKHA